MSMDWGRAYKCRAARGMGRSLEAGRLGSYIRGRH